MSLVNFPNKDAEQEINDQLAAMKAAQQVITNINNKRKKSIDALQNKIVSALEDSDKLNTEHMSAGSVEVLRDVRRGLSETLSVLEAHDSLLDMVSNDMVELVQGYEQQALNAQRTSILMQAIVITMIDKGIVSSEEFRNAQMKVVQELQAAAAEQQAKQQPQR